MFLPRIALLSSLLLAACAKESPRTEPAGPAKAAPAAPEPTTAAPVAPPVLEGCAAPQSRDALCACLTDELALSIEMNRDPSEPAPAIAKHCAPAASPVANVTIWSVGGMVVDDEGQPARHVLVGERDGQVFALGVLADQPGHDPRGEGYELVATDLEERRAGARGYVQIDASLTFTQYRGDERELHDRYVALCALPATPGAGCFVTLVQHHDSADPSATLEVGLQVRDDGTIVVTHDRDDEDPQLAPAGEHPLFGGS